MSAKPEAAVAYLKQKGIAVSWDWQDILDDAHATAFTVAKTAKMDVLSDIYSAVVDAAEQGRTLEEFDRELAPVLQRKGWWCRQEVQNPEGETQSVQLGSPHRLKTIYLTNMQSAYMAGRYAEMMDSIDTHPYWQYVAINDDEALAAFHDLCRLEGIIPALESAHAVAYGLKLARELGRGKRIIVNLSGRGDKDINTIAARDGITL